MPPVNTHFTSLAVGPDGVGSRTGIRGFTLAPAYSYVATPAVIDADGICASQSGTGGTALLINGAFASGGVATLTYARAVIVTSAGNDSGMTFAINGTDIDGQAQSETLTGGNTAAATTLKAFKTVTSIVPSSNTAAAVTVGDSDKMGLPLRVDRRGQIDIYYNNALVTASTGFVAAVTTNPPTATTGDTRGTYTLQSASDGSKVFECRIWPTNDGDIAVYGRTPYKAT